MDLLFLTPVFREAPAIEILFLLLLGLYILISKKNFLMMFVALELIVLSLNLNFIVFSISLADSFGLYFAVILLVLAAVDTAIGLSLFMNYVNQGGNSDITTMRNLKG